MDQDLEKLRVVRKLVERSSRFLSLSGLSGICAGVIAIIGAAFAHFFILKEPANDSFEATHETLLSETTWLLTDAVAVLLLALCCCIYFPWKKMAKCDLSPTKIMAIMTLFYLTVPLFTGGILALVFLLRNDMQMAITMTLTFYGLTLINVNRLQLNGAHFLGLIEIILGIVAIFHPSWSLLLWTIGFGVCHILYGISTYSKYSEDDKIISEFLEDV